MADKDDIKADRLIELQRALHDNLTAMHRATCDYVYEQDLAAHDRATSEITEEQYHYRLGKIAANFHTIRAGIETARDEMTREAQSLSDEQD